MRIFITGASGYIGKAVALAFRRKGHSVRGLVRSDKSAWDLRAAEVMPIIGALEDYTTYVKQLLEAEVIVHCASDYSVERQARDLYAIEHFIKSSTHASLPKTLIYTSGTWVYGNTNRQVVDEASPLLPLSFIKWRPVHEQIVLQGASKHLRPIIFRPGAVYGGNGGLTSLWFSSAAKGMVEIVGDGKNTWSMVHIEDLAEAYVLAAEKELNGAILNVTDGSFHSIRELAETIALAAGIPGQVEALSLAEGEKRFGAMTEGLAVDQKVSSERLSNLLGWTARHKSFLDEIPLYYAAWKARST
jgi:nucleoside-diphosphate-sugar epimerase